MNSAQSTLIAAALLATGCERGAPESDDKNIVVPAGNAQARLETMPEAQRNATFLRAIRDAGRDCQNVRQSAAQAAVDGAPAWTATCDNGSTWVIVIGRDGVAQVTNAAELQAATGKSS